MPVGGGRGHRRPPLDSGLSLRISEGDRPLRVVVLGAHPDDIEIGCFGVLEGLREDRELDVRWVVCSGSEGRREEARASAEVLLAGTRAELFLGEFEDAWFPQEWGRLKRWLAGVRDGFTPDLVLTHHRDDRHQDHRVVGELSWNLFRDALVLEYEVPKYDGELGAPNAFVPMTAEACRRKVEHLLRHFPSQADRPWFTEETFKALARLRGIECGAEDGYAEAFHARKLLLAPRVR